LCFCDAIPKILNRKSVLILQHRRERSHPFNTARLVNMALDRCQLIVGHNADLSKRFDSMSLHENAGLLFPGEDARLLTELDPDETPDQLIVPDGTWHHVKTLMRDLPRLRTLPRYRLAPASPSRYRIRREPDLHGLSTLEATVAAVRAMEPETEGLDRLLQLFDRMIDDQLSHGPANWRHNQRRRAGVPNVPRALTRDLSEVVVAYGEQERGNRCRHRPAIDHPPAPVYWTAVRLVSGERFGCAIQSDSLKDQVFTSRLGLAPRHINAAVSLGEFRDRWHAFLRPRDNLAVFHPSTAKLLKTAGAERTTLILKSIRADRQTGAVHHPPGETPFGGEPGEPSRASQRLAHAVALVESLNRRYRTADGSTGLRPPADDAMLDD
jgi:DTW domain-containing protein YfiP